MSPNKQKDVALACYAVVSGMFARMNNPKNRGPNFTWSKFPDMMAEKCEVEIFIYVNRGRFSIDDIKSYAGKCGMEIATTLVSHLEK